MALPLTESLFVAFISIFIFISFFSNVCVVIAIMKIKTMRTVTNIFLCNLAISDMIIASIVLPQQVHDISHTAGYFEPEVLCKFVNCLPVFCITCSIYIMVALAEERYRAIVLGPGHIIYRKKALVILASIWTLAFLVASPTYVDYAVMPVTTTSQDGDNATVATTALSCMPTSRQFDQGNAIFILFVSYLIPQVLIISRYYRLVSFIVRQGRQTSGALTSSFVLNNRKRIVKMLIIIAALFSVAWLPYFVLLVMVKMSGQSNSLYAASGAVLVQQSLALFSTSYNIVVYLIYNAEFRRSFISMFCRNRTSAVHPAGSSEPASKRGSGKVAVIDPASNGQQ